MLGESLRIEGMLEGFTQGRVSGELIVIKVLSQGFRWAMENN